MTFPEYIASIIPVSEELQEAFYKNTVYKTVEEGDILVRAGEYCNDIYFVESGLLRGYYYQDDKEITNWFTREGEFATNFYSFITKVPSSETIEAVEDCEMIQVPYANLQQLYRDYPETERLGRILTENYYIRLEERLLGLQFTTAKERYENLMKNNPGLILRAQLGHIASYLGITQETLSRIRAKP
jgi:CRP-like cAMP-binding protein